MVANSRSLDIIIGAKDQASGTLKRIEKNVATFAAGFLAFSTVSAVIKGVAEDMTLARRETVGFERDLTELFSLGGNLARSAELRKEVLALSNAYGIARGEIAKSLFDLQSGTANLDEAQRRELLASALELREVYGASLPDALRGLTKTYQIYGDQIDRVNDLQGKVAFLAEEGVVNFTEVSTLLPDVASAADAVDTSLDELLASLVVATQRGGDTGKTFTAVRNVFLRMNNAEREGIRLTGTFTERLAQLNREADADTLKKIFGDEALAAANNLLSSVDQIEDVLGRIGRDLPDVGEKLARALDDPITKLTKISEQITNIRDNGFASQSADQLRLLNQAAALDAALSDQSQTYDSRGLSARFLNLPGNKQAAGALDYALGGPIANNTLEKLVNSQLEAGQLTMAQATLEELERMTGEAATVLRDALAEARIAARDDGQNPLNARLVKMIEGLAASGNAASAESFARNLYAQDNDYRWMNVLFESLATNAEQSAAETVARFEPSPYINGILSGFWEAVEANASTSVVNEANARAEDFITRTLASLGDVDAIAELAGNRVRNEAERVAESLETMLKSAVLSDADRSRVEDALRRVRDEAEGLAQRASDQAGGSDMPGFLSMAQIGRADESRFLTGVATDGSDKLLAEVKRQTQEAAKLNEKTTQQARDIATMAAAIAAGMPLVPANLSS